MDIDFLFKGMKEAKVFGRGTYMSEGQYLVRVKNVKVQPSEKKRGETFFVCEFDVVESSVPEKHKVGSSGTWLPKFSQQSTFGNIKELMFAIVGRSGADVPESDTEAHEMATAMATAACGSDNGKATLKASFGIDDVNEMVIGSTVALTCVQTLTKEKQPFTRYQWAPDPAVVLALAEAKAAQGGT